jgi:hypothetical protein
MKPYPHYLVANHDEQRSIGTGLRSDGGKRFAGASRMSRICSVSDLGAGRERDPLALTTRGLSSRDLIAT